MKKNNSEFGKIKIVDVFNALYYFIGTFLFAISGFLTIGKIPNLQELLPIFGTSLTPALLSIFKSFAKNANGEIFKKEN
jgi:hypothetical protein